MDKKELIGCLERVIGKHVNLTPQDRIAISVQFLNLLGDQIAALRQDLSEQGAVAKRRKAKRKETEVDPKPPVKPVRVAEPSKPRKPKYSGL